MTEKLTFEEANKKLEKIISDMQSGKYTLQETMKVYEEGFRLLNYCYAQLDDYKGQIIDINTRIQNLKKEDLFND